MSFCFSPSQASRSPASPSYSELVIKLLADLAHQRETLDQAYATLNDELFKAQIEASVLNNVQALLVVRSAVARIHRLE